jgi:DNA-binding PadR family transcriptional regulator
VSFEVQELSDVIKVLILLNLKRKTGMHKAFLKKHLEKVCANDVCVEASDLDKALKEMVSEGLIIEDGDYIRPTPQGLRLSKEWRNLLLKREPILEVVAGLVDGSIAGLVVVLSVFMSGLIAKVVTFTALLTLVAVAITNFSSFLLGGITEDLADIRSLQILMKFSLSDIPDKNERNKSLMLVKRLFMLLHKEVRLSNLYAAFICSITTFLAGGIPVLIYIVLPEPINLIMALMIVGAMNTYLIRYRSKKSRISWKKILLETLLILVAATAASLLLGNLG